MTHLSREQLIRWRDHGEAEHRDEVIAHLASCRSCAASYAELARTRPVLEQPAHFDPADFVARGYAVRQQVNPSRSLAWTSWKLWAPLSAAAVLLLVIVWQPGAGSNNVMRGTGIEITAPPSVTDHPEAVTWASGVTAPRFRVELLDSRGQSIFQTVTEAHRTELPAERRAVLNAGESYVWKITALDTDGSAITTASKAFSLTAPATR